MDIAYITSFLLGLVAGVIAIALFLPTFRRRAQDQFNEDLLKHEQVIVDLRQERADDRETNRRLRHELATKTPLDYEATKQERDSALTELAKLNDELGQTSMQLADRDRSLREARLAIHDIRVQLERDRFNASGASGQPSTITGEFEIPDLPGADDASFDDDGAGYVGAHDDLGSQRSTEETDVYSSAVEAEDVNGGPEAEGSGHEAPEAAAQASSVFFGEYTLGDPASS